VYLKLQSSLLKSFAVLLHSSTLEEVSVRANLALTQKKFVNEITAVDPTEKEELDSDYDGLCAQVVRCPREVLRVC